MTNYLKVGQSNESFETYINRSYIGDDLRDDLSHANLLLVPQEGYAEQKDLLHFPSGTSDFYHWLKKRTTNKPGLTIEICIEDAEFREIALRSDELTLATILVMGIVSPVVADLIAEYVKSRLGSREKNTIVKSQILVVDKERNRTIDFRYEGPAEAFRELMREGITRELNLSDRKKMKGSKSKKRRLSRKRSRGQ